jgi:hypothetical protein
MKLKITQTQLNAMTNKTIAALSVVAFAFTACNKTITYNKADIPNDFVALPPMPADSGIQLHIPAFPIPANFEREIFMLKDLGNADTVYVNRIRSYCRAGTHHFVMNNAEANSAFPLPPLDLMIDQNVMDGTANISANANNVGTFFEAQQPDYTLTMPEGFAFKMEPHKKFTANSHYFNKTNATRFGEAYMNFYTIPKNKVTHILENGEINGNEFLKLAPNESKTITTTQIFEKTTQIYLLIPHYHKRGQKFEVKIKGGTRDGETILESYDYQHAIQGMYFNNPIILQKGEGLTTIVTYKNDVNRTISYGVTSEDEMNYLFYYYTNL